MDVSDKTDRGGLADYFPRPSFCRYRAADRRRRLSVLYGGVEAERRVSRASVFSLLTGAGAADAARIRELLDAAYGPWGDAPPAVRRLRDAEEERAREEAREVVCRHWRAVQALTRALLRRQRLSGREIFALATRSSRALACEFREARQQLERPSTRRSTTSRRAARRLRPGRTRAPAS